ncbi:MAG: mannitol dehydrogenase family protein [Caulobacteraceae bacterium]
MPDAVARPGYDRSTLKSGIVHLGLGAFHRAHQAVFTEDAMMAAAGGDWGIVGVSLRHAATRDALAPQDNLYAVERLGEDVRVVGVLRSALVATETPEATLAAIALPQTHIVTLTVTEAGYCLDPDGALDIAHPDVVHDLGGVGPLRSAIGWLARGLAERRRHGAPLTVMSCDNLLHNGRRLEAAVTAFAERTDPVLATWLRDSVAFPCSMVDCIVPASDERHRARVAAALGLTDAASIQREVFAQWAIEDRFAGPRPAWERAGAEVVASVAGHEKLKLHVLNAAHSALAYLGLARGLEFVRQAIDAPDLADFVDAMVEKEIAPALPDLAVPDYWRGVRQRLANPMIDHRLAQIGRDGSVKLAQRVFPMLIANVRAGRPAGRLSAVVRAWLDVAGQGVVNDAKAATLVAWRRSGARLTDALDDPLLFPDEFRAEPAVRAAVLAA